MSTDEQARFTELFERHRHGVHAFLLARTSDPEAARDLLQETFLRVWRRFDETGALDDDRQRAWIYTVARNLVIDRYRSEATRRATLESLAGEVDRAAPGGSDAADEVARRDEVAAVNAAIATLPEDQRVVLTMSVVGGMTSAQIGRALDVPAGTIRYRLHRARAALAERLEVAP